MDHTSAAGGDRVSPERQRAMRFRYRAPAAHTADQGLLDSWGRNEWKTRDAWRSLRILSEFVEGFDTLADLPPARQRLRLRPLQAGQPGVPAGRRRLAPPWHEPATR